MIPEIPYRLPQVRLGRGAEDLGRRPLGFGVRLPEQHPPAPDPVLAAAHGEANGDELSVEPDGGKLVNDRSSIGGTVARRLCGHAYPWAGLSKDISRRDLRNTQTPHYSTPKKAWGSGEWDLTGQAEGTVTIGEYHSPLPHIPTPSDSKRDRSKRRDEEEQRGPGEPAPPPRQRAVNVQDRGMRQPAAGEGEHQEAPHVPARPEAPQDDHQHPKRQGDALVPARQRRVENVTAVELGDGQQVQHGDEHADPAVER